MHNHHESTHKQCCSHCNDEAAREEELREAAHCGEDAHETPADACKDEANEGEGHCCCGHCGEDAHETSADACKGEAEAGEGHCCCGHCGEDAHEDRAHGGEHHGCSCCNPDATAFDDDEDEDEEEGGLTPIFISLAMLIIGLVADHISTVGALLRPLTEALGEWAAVGEFAWYLAAVAPVGWPVLKMAVCELREGELFSEFTLMVIACAGAFAIGEYPEAVAVMLFYAAGEYYQDRAVDRARRSIRALVDLKPEQVRLVGPDGAEELVRPDDAPIGGTMSLRAGERVPLDATLLGTTAADFDTSALTGESVPRSIEPGEEVSAGMLVKDRAVTLSIVRPYADSALARILRMVREAAQRKAPTEQFIRRFARVYTPIVVLIGLAIAVLPPAASALLGWGDAAWTDYIYRGIVFLVVSCPCALVVSVPLSYFSGIGYASRCGILFKGGNYLDALAGVKCVELDKTGTLTRGEFSVAEVSAAEGFTAEQVVAYAAALEAFSTHPLAQAIVSYADASHRLSATDVEERSGRGLRGVVGGEEVLLGGERLLEEAGIPTALLAKPADAACTAVHCAIGGRLAGSIFLEDAPRPEAAETIARLKRAGIERVEVLSGDRTAVVGALAEKVGIRHFRGDLLPEQKVEAVRAQVESGVPTAFVGDGINDAPALALANVGIAMGDTGSDAAVETADVVVRSRDIGRVADAIGIARATRFLVRYNIAFAIALKVIVMILGALGLAPLWLAVLADTGVTIVCVLHVFALPLLVRIRRG